MASSILVPIDGSERALVALEFALEQFDSCRITVIYVVKPVQPLYADAMGGVSTTEAEQFPHQKAEHVISKARERVSLVDEDAQSRLQTEITTGSPAATIVEYVESTDVDHVVMGSRGRTGISRILLGSVAESVARRSPVPVTIVR